MKGNLIVNTMILAFVIILYYATLMLTGYMFSIWDTTPILNTWSSAWDPLAKTFWDFLVWFFIPLCIIIGFIINTKPNQEQVILRRYQ